MSIITVPRLDPNTDAATVLRWRKQPGEAVAAGEVLVELEIERAFVHLEAEAAGILSAISAPAGSTVAVGGALGELAPRPGASSEAAAGTAEPAAAHPTPTPPAARGAVTPILMPQAGNSMEEGTVLEWRVRPGEHVEAGEVLCEIETDKSVVELEAPARGCLARVLAPAGEVVAVRAPIAYLAASDAELEAYLAAAPESPARPVSAASPSAPRPPAEGPATALATERTSSLGERRRASPAARRLAAERDIDLATVGAGSGPRGRILSIDLEGFELGAAPELPHGARRRPLGRMHRAMAANLAAAKPGIPHFYARLTIDAGPLLDLRAELRERTSCSLNDLIILACARVIAEMPLFRSHIEGAELIEHPHADIGIAVGVEEGLVVPVLAAAEELDIAELAAATRRLIERARAGRVHGMGTGVFTVTNLGMFGIEEFSAIINPPEVAILAVSAVREQVLVEGGAMRPGRVLSLTLSSDHRVVDGIAAARFLARLRELLERPGEHLGAP